MEERIRQAREASMAAAREQDWVWELRAQLRERHLEHRRQAASRRRALARRWGAGIAALAAALVLSALLG